jgi:DNA-binding HxlR family transcriptional regulator
VRARQLLSLIFKPRGDMLLFMPRVALADLPGRCCPIAAALDVVGERWALLIVRELALGNSRFQDIVRSTGAPRDRVAARIKALDEAGVIRRVPYQTSRPRFDYQLTESGRALLPVLDALLAWGLDHAVPPNDPDRDRYRWQRTSSKQGGHDDDSKQRRGSDRETGLGPAAIADSHLARPGP